MSRTGKSRDRKPLQGCQGLGEASVTNGPGVSCWDDGEVPELDNGDDGTALQLL